MVIDDATARDIIIRIVSKHWPEKADHAYPGEQFLVGLGVTLGGVVIRLIIW